MGMSGRETKPAPVAAESAAEKPSWSKYDEVTDRDIFLIKYMGAKTPTVPLGGLQIPREHREQPSY